MRSALDDLKLTELHVVHAGSTTFPLSREIQAVAMPDVLTAIETLE
jgi:hypothetical protein